MLKLINSVLFLAILCGGVESTNGEFLQCEFQDHGFFWGSMYACRVSSLDNSNNDKVIKSYTGTHRAYRNYNDVKAIDIDGTNLKYIPEGLGYLFYLTALSIWTSQLVEINSENFLGMQNLEYLSLYENKLTSLPSNTFSILKKLKHLSLMRNQIEEISSELFLNNLNLEEIDFNQNKIKYIGSGAFDQLTNLNKVEMMYNICVRKDYIGSSVITQMKEDIKTKCKHPNEIPATTTTTTTTLSPLEVELNNLKNELFEAEKKENLNEIELNKLWDNLQMEILENTKLTNDHEIVQSINVQLKSELSDLKKVNNESTIKLVAAQKNLNQNQQEKILLIKENNVLKNELTAAKDENEKKTFGYETIEQKNKELMKEKDDLMINNALKKNKHDALDQSINGEVLRCEFEDDNFSFGSMYTCKVSSLDNSKNDMVIKSHTGTHLANRYDNDVKAIDIDGTNTNYIPAGLGSLFRLTAFVVESSELIEIKAENFRGMENLEYLSLSYNKLTSVPADAFSKLTKLKVIYFWNNQIKYIGSGAFDQLTKLQDVYLSGNICVNNYYKGASGITQMKEDIKVNCVEPLSTSTTTTTTTTQNPMEFELEALKNETKDQQQKNEIEFNKLRDDLKKEQLEKQKINNGRDAMATEKGAWIMERESLKMELNIKTKEIIELQLKFETSCKHPIGALDVKLNKINEQLLEAFQNYQTEYLEIVKLKTDLSKEEQKEPKINDTDQLNTTDNMTLSNKCNSFTINCNFMDTNGTYTCETRNLFINQKEMELSKIIGTHMKSKSNEEVTELIIVKSSMSYWSNDIFTKFPALQILKIKNAQLNEYKQGDFSSAFKLTVLEVNGNNIQPLRDDVFHGTEEHLTEINLNSNQIEKISGGTFHGLKQLRVLSLKDNLITEIPFGSFKDIVMLEILILTGNKIRFLDGKMLKFNKRLMTLAVDQNELREVGEDILDHSKMLKDVNLEGNDCIDERTTINDDDTDGRTMNDLNFVIRNCCKNPGEALNVYNCGSSGSVN